MKDLKGLIIDTPAIDKILSGRKIWEMRSTATKQRGPIALIRKGSGQVVGIAEISDSLGPLSSSELLAAQDKHQITPERLQDPRIAKYRFAWVIRNARPLTCPVAYSHPSGAVIWVSLEPEVAQAALAGA